MIRRLAPLSRRLAGALVINGLLFLSWPTGAAEDPGRRDAVLEEAIGTADARGRRAEAVELSRELVALRTGVLGADATATLAARLTLSIMLEQAGETTQARALREAAFDRLAEVDPERLPPILNNTAIALQNTGHPDSAVPVFDRLVAVMADTGESVSLAITHFNLAALHRDRRDYDAAIAEGRIAAEMFERLEGPDAEDTIAAIGALGQTYGMAGRPAAALPHLREAWTRAGQALGPSDETMRQANNLAAVLRDLGRHDEAEPLDRAALDWRRARLGPAHGATLISARNLALDLVGLDRAEEAAGLYDQVVDILARTRGPDHPETRRIARERDMIAILTGAAPSGDPGDFAAMEAQLTTGTVDADAVYLANRLAGIAERRDEPAAELRLHRLSLDLAERHFGPLHPVAISMATNVARAERAQAHPEATAAYVRLEERLRLWARREYASTSDQAVIEQVAATTREALGDILSYGYAAGRSDPQAIALVARVMLNWKAPGSLERALLDRAATDLPLADRDLVARVRRLKAESLRPGADRRAMERLLDLAEAALADRVSGLRRLQAQQALDYGAILSAFRPDDAVLDYMTVPMRMAPDRVEERILVMLGRAEGRIRLFDLGPVAAVADLITVPEAAAGHDTRRRLYDLLIRPVMSELKGVDRLAVVPDGLLTLVPFDVLIDRNGQPMIAALDMRIARSGRALAGGDHDTPQDADRRGVLLVGDVDYGGAATPLPFTAAEIDGIAATARAGGIPPVVLRGKEARADAVRRAAAGQRVLHFATHGFFDPLAPDADDPLERAGVLLAAGSGEDEAGKDGRLTAAELATWPLDGVDLVVLSACDTAQGDRSYVEGLAGLPSALATAGVRRSLLARWPVSDRGAARFMARFYDHLAAGESYEGAFRTTKLDVLEGRLAGVPEQTWAAFTLIAN
ncbi:CHAT domain-containing protein [Tistrella mobilis]|uniref:CHAT domain-containing tetratricopeptide repeat protein n=1 Tax=Tistrella mobilis TaxID=171437 RepID=UPI0035564BFB